MDKKRLEYYKKRLLTRRDELVKTITRTEEEGCQLVLQRISLRADEHRPHDFAHDRRGSEAHSQQRIWTLRYLPGRDAAEAARSRALGEALHFLSGKNGTGTLITPRSRFCRKVTSDGATGPAPSSPCRSLHAGTTASRQTAALPRRSARNRLGAVFAIGKGGRVDNLRVLLLDDVMRAGTTLDACAQAFCEAAAVRHANPVVGKS